MPKEFRAKIRRHAPAAQIPAKRSFALPRASEVVLPGSGSGQLESASKDKVAATATGAGIFGFARGQEPVAGPSKRAIFAAQKEAANLSAHPYSRSHIKREKRKLRERLAGGEMADVASALRAVTDVGSDVEEGIAGDGLGAHGKDGQRSQAHTKSMGKVASVPSQPAAAAAGQKGIKAIGEGKGVGMKERKKRKQIAIEARRIPAIMSHPAYKADPWATIRLHASNTLELKPAVGAGAGAAMSAAAGAGSGDVAMDSGR